jgi:hypothetical protein
MAQAERRSITRRSLVAGSASLVPATLGSFPVVAGPADADPIFAAIVAHARAYADVVALLAAQDEADAAVGTADPADRPRIEARLAALIAAEGPLGLAEIDASGRLVATVPDTLAGAAAALHYVRELFERDGYAPCEEPGYRTLLFSTEQAICRALKAAA